MCFTDSTVVAVPEAIDYSYIEEMVDDSGEGIYMCIYMWIYYYNLLLFLHIILFCVVKIKKTFLILEWKTLG